MEYAFPKEARAWEGTHPRKFVPGASRDPADARVTSPVMGAAGGSSLYQTRHLHGPESIAAGEGTKRHVDPPVSKSEAWRPGLRKVPPPVRTEYRSGVRSVQQFDRPDKSPPERVHFTSWNRESSGTEEFGGTVSRKHKVLLDNGTRAAWQQAHEASLEDMMTQKVRIDPTDTLRVRNGIGVSKPGDKGYSNPDYEPGFFKGGGVLPGSNWGRPPPERHHAPRTKKTETMSYEERRRAELLAQELDSVLALTNTGSEPSWEDRTNMHTVPVKPKA